MPKAAKLRKKVVNTTIKAEALSSEIKRELFFSGKYTQKIIKDKRNKRLRNNKEWLKLYI